MSENKPIKEFRAGKIKGAIWREEKSNDKGTFVNYSISITKSYKDKDTWKETTTFFPDDLPKLEIVTKACYAFIVLKSE